MLIMIKKKRQSAALQVMSLVWSNSSRHSWQTLNHELHSVLESLITLDFEFAENDYADIENLFRGYCWLRVSLNGHHYGEGLYAAGTRSYNNSFCISYEKAKNRVPFLLKTQRVYEGFEFYYDKLWWTVTGWTKDNKSIKVVGYKNRRREGAKKLKEFDRETWLNERKNITDSITKR